MSKMPAIRDVGGYLKEYTVKNAETFKQGAFILLNTDGTIEECGTDPTLILGFALDQAGSLPETSRAVVVVQTHGDRFWMQGSSDPVLTDVNKSYGVIKDGNGIWTVDKTDVVNTRVEVVEVDLVRNYFLVTLKVANIQLG
jgi:hypothetical protein